MRNSQGDRLELAAGRSLARFGTEAGRLTELSFAGRAVIIGPPDPPPGPGSWFWGAFVMAPWTSLIRDARFEFLGTEHRLVADDAGHAVLGLTWKLPWRLDRDRLVCDLTAGWPFGGRVEILPELAPDRLRVRLRVVAGDRAMPAAIGWHPWFARRLPGSEPVRLELPEPVWRQHRDAGQAPTGLWQSVPAGEQWFNDCLRVSGPITLTWPGVGSVTVRCDSPFVTVYSTDPRGVCVEPVTSPAERMDHLLQPGEAVRLTVDLIWTDEEC